jgi:hypothetical protein
MEKIIYTEPEKVSIDIYKSFFKRIGIPHCLKRKEHYLKKIDEFKKVIEFPWRDDQYKVIESFIKYEKQTYIIHAVFGSGKTTLLLGMLVYGVLNELFLPSEIMFVSFNISIKNEIKRKLKKYGMGSKVTVRTFDSIVYEICKHTGYKYLDLPNFEGKRKHVYEKVFDEECVYQFMYQPKVIFIDECQDLEKNTMEVFKRFFPKSKFILAGDIFQSIQKEPRESVLWHYMNKEDDDDVYKIYMSETPRVPKKNLETLKKALSTYYPEFSDKISKWKSSNTTSNADVEWRSLETYTQMFDELEHFCKTHEADETMILTFSSAITVKGAMGDIARFRRFLEMNDIHVNKNHKKMEESDYFLTTANSSKGLERDYVIVFLTFPLEKAFINLSDDVVVNLITVALTRAKKKVIMYVPKWQDKFSRVLNLFEACPKPCERKIREDDKSLSEFEPHHYLNLEHTVTELIRQSIIKYDTRIKLRENIKVFNIEKMFEERTYAPYKIETEEEKAFVGVLIENLITSTWTGLWPHVSSKHIDKNPMYNHCSKKIKSLEKKYKKFCGKNINDISTQFDGIFAFSQLQIAVCNKIIISLSDHNKEKLAAYWISFKNKARAIKPQGDQVKIQNNMKMKLVTGVADALITSSVNRSDVMDDEKKMEEITIVEIKASTEYEWKDDALLQAMCYALMSGKKWSRIVLLNPFMNEKISYYFNTKKILTLRDYIFQDIMMFNINCLLAKRTNVLEKKEPLKVENNLFIKIKRNEDYEVDQVSVLKMVSPIKCEIVLNRYMKMEKNPDRDRVSRCRQESEYDWDTTTQDILNILKSPLLNAEGKAKIYTDEYLDFVEYDDQVVLSNEEKILDDEEKEEDDDHVGKIDRYDSLSALSVFLNRVFEEHSFY